MKGSRFQTVVLLHDRGDSPDGQVGELARILSEAHPSVKFLRPFVPAMSEVWGSFDLPAAKLLPLLQPNALVVGIGLGGLFAVALQEQFTALNLSVFAVNAPPPQDDLAGGWRTGTASGRAAVYSSEYEPLRGDHPKRWTQHADLAFDFPWLSGGIQKAMYATSYLISSYMRGLDLKKAVASLR
jgi:hypothetical protein